MHITNAAPGTWEPANHMLDEPAILIENDRIKDIGTDDVVNIL